jgi:hypothetical protein
MSDSIETAAAPEIIAVIRAARTWIANVGPDPAQWAAKVGGATAIFVGSVQLQFPALITAEAGAGMADADAKLAALEAKLTAPKT